MERAAMALSNVVLSDPGFVGNCRMDRHFHFHRLRSSSQFSRGHGNWPVGVSKPRPNTGAMAVSRNRSFKRNRGDYLVNVCQTGVARLAAAALVAWAIFSLAPAVVAQSLPETVEAINKSRVTTRILFVTAHPDDEWSSLLAYLSHGLNADVALLTITRGQGGQNAIGPEQGGQLGVIRTEELLAAGSHYGVRQFF